MCLLSVCFSIHWVIHSMRSSDSNSIVGFLKWKKVSCCSTHPNRHCGFSLCLFHFSCFFLRFRLLIVPPINLKWLAIGREQVFFEYYLRQTYLHTYLIISWLYVFAWVKFPSLQRNSFNEDSFFLIFCLQTLKQKIIFRLQKDFPKKFVDCKFVFFNKKFCN